MANWSQLRDALRLVDDRVTYTWTDLDALVGGLPRSAYVHSAFWKGERSGWPEFTTRDVRVGESVTFVRRGSRPTQAPSRIPDDAPRLTPGSSDADVILVGCVKQKLDHAAPARDLYTSPLFRKARDFTERTGLPWFVLSAEYGLIAPDTVVEPYDLRLSDTSAGYRREWADRVVDDLDRLLGPLADMRFEVHADAAYVDPIASRLRSLGASVSTPLAGLSIGNRLAWYGPSTRAPRTSVDIQRSVGMSVDVLDLIRRLLDHGSALTPVELVAAGRASLSSPGLYSWWADQQGAADLTSGLGQPVEPGLIYAGLAGATRARSGRASGSTLWGRINGMHLGGRHEFSTFRLSLGSILASAPHESDIDEPRLTDWMYQHLRVVAVPVSVSDAESLDAVESDVLAELDPPLNLAKVGPTDLRQRLSDLRRRYVRKRNG